MRLWILRIERLRAGTRAEGMETGWGRGEGREGGRGEGREGGRGWGRGCVGGSTVRARPIKGHGYRRVTGIGQG
jgi:hypothetical protein